MDEVRRVLAAAGRRLFLVRLLASLTMTLTAALGTVLALRVADRLLILGVPWLWVFAATLGSAVVIALVWCAVRPLGNLAVARVVDESAGLRQTLSTALCVERSDDPWSRAVVESAGEAARRVVVRDAVPIAGPRTWPTPAVVGLALAVVWFLLPPIDLRGALAAEREREQEEKAIAEAKADALQSEQKIRELLAKSNLGDGLGDALGDREAQIDKPQTAEEVRRAAIRKLTSLTERLAAEQSGEKGQKLDTLQEMLRQLRTPGRGPMTELSRELAKGNFDKARQMLDELAQKMGDGSMSPEEREQLKAQMENLAKQMQQLAEQKTSLEQALRQAGMSGEQAKEAAANPQALQQALENMQNLSPEQKQQLQQMAEAVSKACESCSGLGEAMSKMAQGMGQSGMSQDGMSGMESLAGQLSELEMLSQEMGGVNAAMQEAMAQLNKLGQSLGECEWGQCSGTGMAGMTGQWRPGSNMGQGMGSGGPGQGNGEGPEEEAADFMVNRVKARVHTTAGPIIGSRLVQGDSVKGEALAEFATAVQVSSQEAAEALQTMQVPREYHGAVKHYFGTLEERVRAERAKKEAAGDGGK
ncbi:MAG: hypothetical protein KIS87_08490 [Phycisphaeraceae bacterium]|nr:hypothetical protein [Phycisphaeraceae bacterium]